MKQYIDALEVLIARQDAAVASPRHDPPHHLPSHHPFPSDRIVHHHDGAPPQDDAMDDPADMFTFDNASSDSETEPTVNDNGQVAPISSDFTTFLVSNDWEVLMFSDGLHQAREGVDGGKCRCVTRDVSLVPLGCGATSVVLEGRLNCSQEGSDVSAAVAVRCATLDWRHRHEEQVYEESVLDAERKTVRHRFRSEVTATRMAMSCSETGDHIARCFGFNVLVAFESPAIADGGGSGDFTVELLNIGQIPPDSRLALKSVLILSVHELGGVGTLAARIAEVERFQPLVARDILMDVTKGLVHLHQRCGVVHGDVKPQNVLGFIDAAGCVRWKLSDFGLARTIVENTLESLKAPVCESVGGTVIYMSPQACRGVLHPSNDVWSVGIMGIQLLTGHVPWSSLEARYPAILYSGLRSTDAETLSRPQLGESRAHAQMAGADSMTARLMEILFACLDEALLLTSEELLCRLSALVVGSL